MKMFRYITAMVLSVLVVGCSVTTPATKEYRLAPKVDKAELKSCQHHSIKLLPTVTKNYLRSGAMHYIIEPFEEGSYIESAWATPPADTILSQLYLTLNDAKILSAVYTYGSIGNSDWVVEVRLDDFVQFFDKAKKSSFVVIDMTLTIYNKKDRKLIASKRFVQTQQCDTLDAQGGVEALNIALEQTLHEVLPWFSEQCR